MSFYVAPLFGKSTYADPLLGSSTANSPIDAAFTGTAGSLTGSGTNASFASGQFVLISQYQGTGVGQMERNFIVNYSAGTITFSSPLTYTYTTGAQITVIKDYAGLTINAGTFSSKPWDGTTGGIFPIICAG